MLSKCFEWCQSDVIRGAQNTNCKKIVYVYEQTRKLWRRFWGTYLEVESEHWFEKFLGLAIKTRLF